MSFCQCINARIEGAMRYPQYHKIKQSLYCQFIQKISTEIDRYTMSFMSQNGWEGNDFSIEKFIKFSDGLLKKRGKTKLSDLPKYNAYNLLHKINNFLKHNSIFAYEKLKKSYPENVISSEKYENGMFAGDWIKIKPNYIDDILKKLVIFFENYCNVYLGEDIEKSNRDYDDYFYCAKKEMQYPEEYLGIYI